MSTRSAIGPEVDADSVEFSLADPALRGVALLNELRGGPLARRVRPPWPRLGADVPAAGRGSVRVPARARPIAPVGARSGLTPPTPSEHPGPFGEKSVIEFPGYERPEWVDDEDVAHGSLRVLELESFRLRRHPPGAALVGRRHRSRAAAPAAHRPRRPGVRPTTRRSSVCSTISSTSARFRSAARRSLPPPGGPQRVLLGVGAIRERARGRGRPGRDPRRRRPTGCRCSPGRASVRSPALHAHFRNPGVFGGLFLQSGSFFRRRFDAHEARFSAASPASRASSGRCTAAAGSRRRSRRR